MVGPFYIQWEVKSLTLYHAHTARFDPNFDADFYRYFHNCRCLKEN